MAPPPKYDVSVLDGPGEGKLVSGIEKLAQTFLIELSTELGSLAYSDDHGTRFLGLLVKKRYRTEAEVLGVLSAALLDLRRHLASDELFDPGRPDDEKLEDVGVQRLTLLPGAVLLTLKVSSVAGDDMAITTSVEISP